MNREQKYMYKEKICYWCGNTGMTWDNNGEGGEGEYVPCTDHEFREDGQISTTAQLAILDYKHGKI